jgi:hypothetical protein
VKESTAGSDAAQIDHLNCRHLPTSLAAQKAGWLVRMCLRAAQALPCIARERGERRWRALAEKSERIAYPLIETARSGRCFTLLNSR